MSNLQLIKSDHFGDIETDIYSNGNDMFMTISQIAGCLGYATRRGVEMLIERNPYLKEPEFSVTHKLCAADDKTYDTRIFTEDGIYEVTMLSGQPKAKEFRRWIRGILKGLRTGKVRLEQTNPLAKEMAEAKLNNSRARVSNQWLKIAQTVDIPEFKQICASYASNALAGCEVIPLPTSEQKYLQAKDIGKMFGISASMVGRIANENGLKTDTYGKWFHDKAIHSNKEVDTFRYNDAAIEKFEEILAHQTKQKPTPKAPA